jgi:hypothetical protein
MNTAYQRIIRVLIGIAFLLLLAGGVSARLAHSAEPNVINVDTTLKLVKSVTNNDGGAGVPDDWTLSAEAANPDHDRNFSNAGGSGNFEPVYAAVSYNLSESSLLWTDGVEYNAGTWSCDGGSLADSSLTLSEGEAVTCTITNDDITTLKLVKTVNNNDNGSGAPDDWILSAAASSPDDSRNFSNAGGSGTFKIIFANVGYNLSESSLLWANGVAYNAGTWSCDGGSLVNSVITLAEGQTGITCTITNDDIAPKLTVVKNPTNDSGFTASPDEFKLTVGGVPVLSSVQNPYLANTPLAINETLVAGYRFHSITGDAKCPADLGGTITMEAGDVITCTITNNDIGVNITPTSGLLTSESGLPTASFDVVLDAIPTADVSLALSSSDISEGTIDKSSLTFTDTSWNIPQTVTITGVNDFIADGDQPYTIVTGPITSLDLDYTALDPIQDIPDVSVTNSDNDTSGYSITPTTDLWTSEGGAFVKVQILLKSRPTSQVLLTFSSSDLGEGTVTPKSILIDPTVWPQTSPNEIIITGVDDCETDGDIPFTVTINAASIPPNPDLDYNGHVADLLVTNYEAPTIAWVKPVGNGGIYSSDGISPIQLEIKNLCSEPISKVRFYRWVPSISDHVTIGEDISPPYQELILPGDLESGWNQVFAFAFGPPNPIQTFSKHEHILILKDFDNLIFLPLVSK